VASQLFGIQREPKTGEPNQVPVYLETLNFHYRPWLYFRTENVLDIDMVKVYISKCTLYRQGVHHACIR
jgi:hypothetical protein